MELAIDSRRANAMPPPRSETVRLSPGNWIALAGLVLAIVTALIGGVWQISETQSETRYELRAVREAVLDIGRRVDRLEHPPNGT